MKLGERLRNFFGRLFGKGATEVTAAAPAEEPAAPPETPEQAPEVLPAAQPTALERVEETVLEPTPREEQAAVEAPEGSGVLVEVLEREKLAKPIPEVIELTETEKTLASVEDEFRELRRKVFQKIREREEQLARRELELDRREELLKREEEKLVRKAMRLKQKDALDEDVRRLLIVLDDLLGRLPEEYIKEFIESEDYALYEKVLEIYGIE